MIVVGGEALVDLVGGHGQLSPVPGGGPFNTATALGRLGIPVAYLGTLSRADLAADLSYLSNRFADPAGLIVIPEQATLSLSASASWLAGAR